MTVVRLVTRDMLGQGPVAIGAGNVQLAGTHWEAARPFTKGSGTNKVAVVPISGVLTSDGPSYYGTNYATISDAVEKAANDPDVSRIILAVDSPGGEVTGLPETAGVIAAAAKVKPVSAIVEGAAASAAYWLTSQASDITLTPSGEVGSVGVRMMHVDMSRMLDAEGYTVSELSSGDFKTEWSPYKPLTDEAKANMQTRLDASHAQFLSAIASGRGTRVSQEMTEARYGEGRMHSSAEALAGGLVDKVQPAREFFRSVGRSPVSGSIQRAELMLRRARLKS